MLIKITETDETYVRHFTKWLCENGARLTSNETILEVPDGFPHGNFHGLSIFNPQLPEKFKAEIEWLQNYKGDFPFYLSLKQQYASRGSLSEKQMASLTKAVAREQIQKSDMGCLAVEDFKRPELISAFSFSIKPGAIIILKRFFAKDTAAYAGCVRPHFAFEVLNVLSETEKAFKLTLKCTAQRTSHCGICGIHLTNPESVMRGIGPICAGYYGIESMGDNLSELAAKLMTTTSVTRWLPKAAIKERYEK